ncbi:MAG: beta-hydroxyacyl-ACP dehydratase, partial [Planctomycetota bacterium]|nr:beta-hydroxyacyl-ACP dehydratase [Planctomycetota bacterium]
MPPILDMELVDPEVCAVPEERLRTILPQRYELQMVDSVCYLDHDAKIIVAYKDLKVDDWWTRGHFPG